MREIAPAKLNLCLHVTGRRADGFHLLESLVAFADFGDFVALDEAGDGLTICGEFADLVPQNADNLLRRAAALCGYEAGIFLEKNLPVAAGIGGGSADAAALFRLLDRAGYPLPTRDQMVGLGADIPVCFQGDSCLMCGIGERLRPVPTLPDMAVLLVNPGWPLSTKQVFSGLENYQHPSVALPDDFADYPGFVEWLSAQRNDLEQPAMKLAPQLAALQADMAATEGLDLVRMSGSGSSFFGLCSSLEKAADAGEKLRQIWPDAWMRAGRIG